MVAHAWKILHSAASQKHDAVFLEVVAFVRDVRDDFDAAGESNLSHFANGRIRLLGRASSNLHAYPPAKRASLQCRRLGLGLDPPPRLSNELVDSGHLWKNAKKGIVDSFI